MGSKMLKERALMARNDVWHRIKIIRAARYDKEVVLKTILAAVEPADLIPVRYQVNGDDAYFMARNCGAALEMLCRSNLIINLPNGDPIVIIVTLAFASIHDLKINIQPILLAALTKRYDSARKNLNLKDFHRDEEIAKTVHCPLSQARTLSHTLKLAKTALGPFEHLNLQQNELMTLNALENSNLSSLRGIDLRGNYIMRMDDIAALKDLTITELWLDGNPVCENYSSPRQYIESAKRCCPGLTRLDGVTLDMPELPLTYDNFFKNNETRQLVSQFIAHFFGIYDRDRSQLHYLYHKKSVYSMTLGESSVGSSGKSNVGPFQAENRNIINAGEFARDNLLYRGPGEIIGALERLPKSVHDRGNLRCDVMFADRHRVLVSVEGIFKIPNAVPIFLSFNRTFLLVAREGNEYNIVNDQYHVDAAAVVSSTSFDDRLEEVRDLEPCPAPLEKERLIFTLMDTTSMNTEWCHRFLEDTNWDARKAIEKFMDNYETSKIPADAFGR